MFRLISILFTFTFVSSSTVSIIDISGLKDFYTYTGGRNWALDELDELAQAISYSAAGITEQQLHPLWDAPLLFLLLLLLKAAEWTLRRYWKTI